MKEPDGRLYEGTQGRHGGKTATLRDVMRKRRFFVKHGCCLDCETNFKWPFALPGNALFKKKGHFQYGAPHGRGYALSLGSKYEGRACCSVATEDAKQH